MWKRNGPDHYAHALLYAVVGMQRYGGESANVIDSNPVSNLQQGFIGNNIGAGVSPSEFRSENRVL